MLYGNPWLPTDSQEYEILQESVQAIRKVPGLTCEIGVRLGGGTRTIIDTLMATENFGRTHICVDPYGDILYHEGENDRMIKLDYTNQMRDECLKNLYAYVQLKPVNVLFFMLEDTEFFNRFSDGVPVYYGKKQIFNTYAFVHFDGPHTPNTIIPEVDFFDPRSLPGTRWVFDDIMIYDHDVVEQYIFQKGWELVAKGNRKASYVKK